MCVIIEKYDDVTIVRKWYMIKVGIKAIATAMVEISNGKVTAFSLDCPQEPVMNRMLAMGASDRILAMAMAMDEMEEVDSTTPGEAIE